MGLPLKSRVDHVVEKPEFAAEFGGGLTHYGDVLADELADHFDERAHRTAGADDARHPARRAAVADRLEQPGLVDAEPVTEPDGLVQQPDLRGEQRVVDELDALAGADGADVKDRVAVAGQHGPDPLDSVIGATDKQR